LGEEANVHLDRVTLDGSQGKLYRQILRRGERDGLRMRILAPVDVAAVLPELRDVSDEWLEAKHQRERQFSIGFFDEEDLQRFPCAVVEKDPFDPLRSLRPGRIVAFANLLRDPAHGELSVDLMRYRTDAPNVMDFLFVSLFFHAKENGYKRFNLGMAPLASV